MRVRRFAAWAVAGLAGVVLVVASVGATLPVAHRASRRAVVRASPARVYALISDVDRLPAWRTGVTRVEVVRRGDPLRYREFSGGDAILYSIDEAVPPARWVSRIADDDLPFGGRWVFTLRPSAGGTAIEIVEEGKVYNPLFRFVSRFVIGHDAGIEQYLTDLAAQVNGLRDDPALVR